MRKLFILMMLGAFAAPVIAQDATEAVTVRGYQIDLPQQRYRMFNEEFGQFVGGYELSNGQSLVMMKSGRRMYAKLDGGEQHELVAASPNEFVALDRSMKITLNVDKMDAISGEMLIMPWATPLASNNEVIKLRLVSAR